MIMRAHCFLTTALFLVFGCALAGNKASQIDREIVMTEGMKITATNAVGTITITAGKGFERSYTWDGDTRTAVLSPRQKRWAGKFGVYSKGKANWKEHNRITRGVLEEAQLHFKSSEEALLFLNDKFRKPYIVYNDEGLVVKWETAINPTPGPGSALLVDVFQIYINGEKPNKLTGSQNDKIKIVQENR